MRRSSSRLVAHTRKPMACERDAGRRDAAAHPLTNTVSPGRSPARVASIRYAVNHAVGRQAASAKDQPAGLGSRLRLGTATSSAKDPWKRSLRSDRAGSRVSSPTPRVADDGVQHNLIASSIHPGRIAPQDHGKNPLRYPRHAGSTGRDD